MRDHCQAAWLAKLARKTRLHQHGGASIHIQSHPWFAVFGTKHVPAPLHN